MTMSAPQAATFSACRAAPTLGITTMPWSLSLAISSCFGASAKDATFTPCLISRSTRSGASPASARRLTPNGWSVRPFTSRIACSSSSYVIVALARMPSPPAFGGAGDQPRAGDPAHAGLHDGVAHTGQLGQRRGDQLLDHDAVPRACVAQALRVEHLADQDELLRRGSPRLRDVVADLDLAAAGRTHLVDGHARVDRAQPQRVAGAAEVEHRQVGHDPVDVVEAQRGRPGRLRPRRPDAGDHVDLLDEHAGAVLAAPSTTCGC